MRTEITCDCGTIYNFSKFGKCRVCRKKEYWAAYLKKPGVREMRRNAVRQHRAKNPEYHNMKSMRWQQENKEKTVEIRKKTVRGIVNRYTRAVRTARVRGFVWEITRDQFANLISKPCHYCNGELAESGVGLDRTDNSLGYTMSNVEPCCADCNRIKANRLTQIEMQIAMRAVMDYRRLNYLKLA